jgi:hypothetical protein
VIVVRPDCTPPIVNDILTVALGDLPDVTLVAHRTEVPDVVVVSAARSIRSGRQGLLGRSLRLTQ